MNSLVRWIPAVACILVIPSSPPALGKGNASDAKRPSDHVSIRSADRSVLLDDIVHYRYQVVVGPGQFDVIRLHRIVRERRPYHPIQTADGVFLLPGGPNYFEAAFIPPLISRAPGRDQSIALFLAKNGLDVWGMDYAWALVPAETTNFDFMKDWGVARDGRQAEIALALARRIRGATGQGFDPVHLLGYSYGAIVGYALAGEETQRPPSQRSIKGFIPLDFGLKLGDDVHRAFYCADQAVMQANLDAGVYSDDFGLFAWFLADLALSAPFDPSGVIPGTTNYQAALMFGTSTELLSGQFWHFVGGYLDGNGVPSDLHYTDARLWLDLLKTIPPHFPMRSDVDVDAVLCGSTPVPFDDHLGRIALPILYVGTAGGFGEEGLNTTKFTASKDVTEMIVQLLPDDQRQMDFAHADAALAKDAETLVWRPVLDWIVAHKSKNWLDR